VIEEILTGAEALREQQERFALAVLATNDGLWDWDLRSNTVYYSPRWKAVLGYAEHEIANSPEEWQSRIHPDDRERAQATLHAHLLGETAFYELEHRLRHKDGTYRWILARGKTQRDDHGQPYRMAGVHTDITARKEAEEAVRESEALYRSLVETSPDAIVLVALDGTILLANQRGANLFGACDPQAMIGTDVLDLAAADHGALLDPARIAGVLDACCVRNREYILRRRDGTSIPVEMSASLIRGPAAEPRAYLSVIRDISDRKQAEQQLREKEEQYRRVFEATRDGLIINDLNGYVIEANPAAWEMHGYTREEFIGLHHTAYVHPDVHDRLPRLTEAIEAGRSVHVQGVNVRKDGTSFPVDVHGTTFLYKGTPHVLAVVRDVTAQTQAYELLEARVEERTRVLSTLLEVSRRVASTLRIEPLLGVILDQLKAVVDYRGGSLLKLKGEELIIVEYRGPNPREEVVGLHFPLARIAPIWELARQGRPVMIPDVRGDDLLARAFREGVGPLLDGIWSYIRSWMGIPLVQKGQTIGLLSLAIDRPNFYNAEQATLALALASQAAIAMENAKLYEQAQEAAALEERARLARELHDSVTQALFSMTMHAEAAQMALQREGGDPAGRVARNLSQLRELTAGALAEMRALIFELRPGALQEEGLATALRKHTAALSAREGLPIEVQAPEGRIALEPSTEEHLYRLAQEALHNVVKHAGAGRAVVRLEAEARGRLVLEIDDDGAGFDPATIPDGHLGLRTMADRAQHIGGTLEVRSAPGAGTAVRVVVPVAVSGDPRDW
jgi:PAS domain S-box-containing protein